MGEYLNFSEATRRKQWMANQNLVESFSSFGNWAKFHFYWNNILMQKLEAYSFFYLSRFHLQRKPGGSFTQKTET